jgi:N-acetylglucosamine-6-phosphate deacetylase
VGRIAPGQRANLVLLDENLQVRDTWIDGVGDPRSSAISSR